MKCALIVGINAYEKMEPLKRCVNDAEKVKTLLLRNDDAEQSANMECDLFVSPPNQVTRVDLRKRLKTFFNTPADLALFYFAGHGMRDRGGILVTQDGLHGDAGISMKELLDDANESKAREVIIILDCCFSGLVGNTSEDHARLREGVSILTASCTDQVATEDYNGGMFTTLVCDALRGGAADIAGNVTTASVYAFIDQLANHRQRPMYKAHVAKLVPIRRCKPAINLATLRKVTTYFPDPDYLFPLDPSYEPHKTDPEFKKNEPHNLEHEAIFEDLQKYNRRGLLDPVGEQHMYYAAKRSKPCRLTELGKFYWHTVKAEKI